MLRDARKEEYVDPAQKIPVTWFHVKSVPWGILPAFLMTFSGMSQDIAAPSMANVDLEMEDEKKIAAYRVAMARHLQLGIIWTCIVELEEKDNRAVLVATLKYIQSPEWAGILDKCPPDYRAMHLKMIRESGKLLERVEREKMTADEIQNAYGEYGGQYMKMGGASWKISAGELFRTVFFIPDAGNGRIGR